MHVYDTHVWLTLTDPDIYIWSDTLFLLTNLYQIKPFFFPPLIQIFNAGHEDDGEGLCEHGW